jgi:hypothetical protein
VSHAYRLSVHELLHVHHHHAPNLFGSALSLRQGAFEISGSPSISAGVHAFAFAATCCSLNTACLCGCVVVPWAVAAVLIVALVPRSFLRSMCVSDEIEERILLKIGMTLAV